MEALADVYESLKGTKVSKSGRLVVEGFTGDDYENLFDYLVTEVISHILPDGCDYYDWLARKAHDYYRHRIRKRFYPEKPDPLILTPADQLDTQQQLAILKYVVYRRYYNPYT